MSGQVAELPLSGVGAATDTLTEGEINTSTIAPNVAQTFPTDETITGITVYVSTSEAFDLLESEVTITAQLYTSTTPDNVFTPVPGASVTASPAFTGIGSLGTIASGIVTGLSIPVTAQTRGMLVVSATPVGIALVNSIPL
ncbi:MAG TPA: exosporium glycoprotein BclB-related protein, partial [Gaiellaceae bacterium]